MLVVAAAATAAAYVFHLRDADAIATAFMWARLAPLPAAAHDRHVQVRGSVFTREFIITFIAPPETIQGWISASPGPASAPRVISGTVTTYKIVPGGGAEFAQVQVDRESGKVIIRTYWS